MTHDTHPAEVLAAYAEMWACGGENHNARCSDIAEMLRTIPALEESARQQALDYLTLDSQCAELIAERDRLREALAAERERWRLLIENKQHIYNGYCPDAGDWNSRDPECPACCALGDWLA